MKKIFTFIFLILASLLFSYVDETQITRTIPASQLAKEILSDNKEIENWQDELSRLQDTIGYKFTNLSLLKLALIHRSYLHKKIPELTAPSERLEFLGDAVLGYIVVEYL